MNLKGKTPVLSIVGRLSTGTGTYFKRTKPKHYAINWKKSQLIEHCQSLEHICSVCSSRVSKPNHHQKCTFKLSENEIKNEIESMKRKISGEKEILSNDPSDESQDEEEEAEEIDDKEEKDREIKNKTKKIRKKKETKPKKIVEKKKLPKSSITPLRTRQKVIKKSKEVEENEEEEDEEFTDKMDIEEEEEVEYKEQIKKLQQK